MRFINKKSRPLTLAGLRGFASAARHLSFTRAAEELHLSQPALSRQIQTLEDELGVPLFVRTTRRIALTLAGEALARAVQAGLKTIDECVERLRAVDARQTISVTTFASFASLWLIPRLARFADAYPKVDVNCIATDRLVDLDNDNIDIALRCSSMPIAASDGEYLFDEFLAPACSPALLDAGPALETPADLRHFTLLSNEVATETRFPWLSWERWFEAQQVPLAARSQLRFTNHDQVIQAALAGQGVVLARGALTAELIAAGRLALPLGAMTPTTFRYYVVTGSRARQRPEVGAFVDWVRAEAAASRQLQKPLIDAEAAEPSSRN